MNDRQHISRRMEAEASYATMAAAPDPQQLPEVLRDNTAQTLRTELDTLDRQLAQLREKYLEATGEEPLDRGCYPSSGARLRVGVDGRRVFPRMRAGLGNGTHPDDIPPVFAP